MPPARAAAVVADGGVLDSEALASSSVWAKSRAVTSTSCPSARIAPISGRMTRT